MTLETASKISRTATGNDIQKWSVGVGKFVSEVHPKVAEAMSRVCSSCPFRSNPNIGGCIGEECPVHAVMKSVNLSMKRAANGTKLIYKSKYMKVPA